MWASIRRAVQAVARSFLWLVVLVPILGVSAYSLYYIGRYFGAPWFIAIAFSTCFDGVALLAAGYSVRYAQAGLSGGFPRSIVRIFALIAAFLQTFHARIGHELPGAWILWASLPVGAVLVYEIHIRWERRKALARAGSIYPAPLPQFGLMSWLLFPLSTLNQLREITLARRTALVTAANVVIGDFQRETTRTRNTRERIAEPAEPAMEHEASVVSPDVVEQHRRARQASPARPASRPASGVASSGRSKRPKDLMRAWLKANGHPELGDFGRIPRDWQAEFYAAHPREEAGGGL